MRIEASPSDFLLFRLKVAIKPEKQSSVLENLFYFCIPIVI